MNKPKVAILGVTGMLGSEVYNVLKNKYNLVITYRDTDKLQLLYATHGPGVNVEAIQVDWMQLYKDYESGFQGKLFGSITQQALDQLGNPDWVINAVGIIKPHSLKDPVTTLFINGALPQILVAAFGDKLIHIATDCVYDGTENAPYNEASIPRPIDLYGMSKLLGEPQQALVLRTSIIGPELGSNYGLLGWFQSQAGQPTKGFTNHLWNGITTREFGKICNKIISGEVAHPGGGVYHIHSTEVTKYEMLVKFKEIFNLDIQIEPVVAPIAIDRRLATKLPLNVALQIPAFSDMVTQLTPQEVKV